LKVSALPRQSCDGDASSGGSTTEQEEEEEQEGGEEKEMEVLLPNSILANPARFQALIKFGRSVQEFSQQVPSFSRYRFKYIFFSSLHLYNPAYLIPYFFPCFS
jgi:hypothetical protein